MEDNVPTSMEEPLIHTNNEDGDKTVSSSALRDFSLFPSSVKYLVWNEFCERFSYYGMRAILALFLLDRVGLSETKATEVVHLFIVACYATPVLGAIISDCYLGKYRTILYLSLVYSLGNWFMAAAAVPSNNASFLFSIWSTTVALALIAIGTGGIKPCVTAFGGDQIELSMQNGVTKDRLKRKFFSVYYFAINAGSLVSTVLTPVLREDASYAVAFAVPALLMLLAVLIFWMGEKTYIDRPPEGNVIPIVGRVTVDAFVLRNHVIDDIEADKEDQKSRHWLDAAKLKHHEDIVEDVKTLLQVLVVLLPAPLFWSLFDQQSSKWVFQARDMDGHVSWLGGLEIQPDQMQAMNPVLILLMIPFFDQIVYPLSERVGLSLKPVHRMLMGMLFGALAFLLSGFLQLAIDTNSSPNVKESSLSLDTGDQVSMLWQIPQYILITAGEIMFSITGLEFAYSQAPNSMKSVVQSFWLLTVASGNLVTVAIVAIIGDKLTQAYEFFFFSGGCIFAMLLMAWLGSNFNYRNVLTTLHLDDDQQNES